MQLFQTITKHRRTRFAPRRRSGEHRPAAVAPLPAPAAASAPSVELVRARRAGGSEDRELFTCECGYVFHAPPTTTVACAICGTPQAW